jgi:hypothetical protein
LAARLRASIGARLLVDVLGVGPVEGRLHRVGEGWLLVGASQDWIVATGAVGSVRGLLDRVAPSGSQPVEGRLGMGSVLRGLVAARSEVVVHRMDGRSTRCTLGKVGADFMEVCAAEGGHAEVLPFTAVAAVRSC